MLFKRDTVGNSNQCGIASYTLYPTVKHVTSNQIDSVRSNRTDQLKFSQELKNKCSNRFLKKIIKNDQQKKFISDYRFFQILAINHSKRIFAKYFFFLNY